MYKSRYLYVSVQVYGFAYVYGDSKKARKGQGTGETQDERASEAALESSLRNQVLGFAAAALAAAMTGL